MRTVVSGAWEEARDREVQSLRADLALAQQLTGCAHRNASQVCVAVDAHVLAEKTRWTEAQAQTQSRHEVCFCLFMLVWRPVRSGVPHVFLFVWCRVEQVAHTQVIECTDKVVADRQERKMWRQRAKENGSSPRSCPLPRHPHLITLT
jgi:hypothetical protein